MKTGLSVILIVYLNTVAGQKDCHCLDKTRCPYNCNSQCDPGWLGTSCLTKNIAFNMTAIQSSTGQICSPTCESLPASLAVDGDTRTESGARCSRTAEQRTTASLSVTLHHHHLIDRVGIYFSTENTEDRRDFRVLVEDKLCYQRPNNATVTSYIQIFCDQQLLGRTVTVYLPLVSNTYRILALCEMEIYECERLWWGEKCAKKCVNCTDSCDQRTGACYNRFANIANGHNTYFKPDNRGVSGTADQVIDGDTADSNCAFVNAVTPWWEIQFNETRTITKMKIFWSNTTRPGNFAVLVDNHACYVQAPPSPLPPREFSFSCDIPLQGSKVRIIRQGGQLDLRLCEVEIYECLDGFYDSNCNHRCPCQGGEMCDKTKGTCFNTTTSEPSSTTSTITKTKVEATTTTTPTTTTITTTKTTTTSTGTSFTTTFNRAPPSSSENATVTSLKMTAESNSYASQTTTTTPQSATADVGAQQRKDRDMIPIIGAAVGGGVGLILIVVIVAVVCRWKRRKPGTPLENNQKEAQPNSNAHTNLGFTNEAETPIQATAVNKEPQKPVKKTTMSQKKGARVKLPAPKCDQEELPEDPEEEPLLEETYDPYYNHVPRAVPVSSLRGYVQDRLDGVGFGNEYAFLPAGLRTQHDIGKTVDNNLKNRFKHIYAYDHSRVLLERDEEEEMEGETDYINASYIHGYKCQKKFIATQGPIPITVADFWLMVWQQNTRQIVMLTNIYEQERKKCEQYWPPHGQPDSYGIIHVTLEKTKQHADYTIRVFTLCHLGDNTRREITQFHFTTWPDHGVPSMPSLVSFWRRVRRDSTSLRQDIGPTVVHCSAGIGRTGTYIALDSLVEEAVSENKVNIFTAVLGMRDDRVNMVQTKGQYSFLHLAILEALYSKNTWTPADRIQDKLAKGNSIIQEEYQNMNMMTTLRIPVEKKRNRGRAQESSKEEDSESEGERDIHLNDLAVTFWPSYFAKRGFLHVGTCEDGAVEEFWRLVHRKNVTTVVTIDQGSPMGGPTKVGQSSRIGPVSLTLNSKKDVSAGITEWKLTSKYDSTDEEICMDVGDKEVVVYSITSTKPRFDRSLLLSIINLISVRQQTETTHPVIVYCRDDPSKCAVIATAANVVTWLRLDQEVDIYLMVREIQCHKGQPVTCLDDYRFLYEMASDYIKSTNTYANT